MRTRPPSVSSSSAILAATSRTPGEYVGDSISTSSRSSVSGSDAMRCFYRFVTNTSQTRDKFRNTIKPGGGLGWPQERWRRGRRRSGLGGFDEGLPAGEQALQLL